MAPGAQGDEPAFDRFVRWLIDPEVDADLRGQGMGYDDPEECRAYGFIGVNYELLRTL